MGLHNEMYTVQTKSLDSIVDLTTGHNQADKQIKLLVFLVLNMFSSCLLVSVENALY